MTIAELSERLQDARRRLGGECDVAILAPDGMQQVNIAEARLVFSRKEMPGESWFYGSCLLLLPENDGS